MNNVQVQVTVTVCDSQASGIQAVLLCLKYLKSSTWLFPYGDSSLMWFSGLSEMKDGSDGMSTHTHTHTHTHTRIIRLLPEFHFGVKLDLN